MIEAIFAPSSQIVEKAMSLRMMRHGLLASNVANAETPNYRAVDIDFKATMEKLVAKARRAEAGGPLDLTRSAQGHFTIEELSRASAGGETGDEQIVFAAGDSETIGNDNNSVDLDTQLARMQMNALMYSTLAQLLGKQINGVAQIVESTSRY